MASLGPSISGLTMSLLSEVMPKPHSSASILAPRALACSIDFQHQDARALAQHRAVALLGEREAALRREHVHGLPGPHDAVVDDALGGADDGDVGQAVADVVAADADGVRRRGAGAAGGERRPLDAELDADMRRRRGADEAQQRQRMGGALLVDEQVAVARFPWSCRPPAPEPTMQADAIGVLERHLEARLLDGLVGRRRGKPGVAVGVQDDLVALEVLEARPWGRSP